MQPDPNPTSDEQKLAGSGRTTLSHQQHLSRPIASSICNGWPIPRGPGSRDTSSTNIPQLWNPYRTVDAMTVDLTTFNGLSASKSPSLRRRQPAARLPFRGPSTRRKELSSRQRPTAAEHRSAKRTSGSRSRPTRANWFGGLAGTSRSAPGGTPGPAAATARLQLLYPNRSIRRWDI